MSRKISTFCKENWSRAVRTAFYVFTGSVWKIWFPAKSLKFLLSFSDTEQNIFDFLSIFFNGVANSVFYVSQGLFRWKEFSRKIFKFSIFLRTLTGKNSLIRQAFFSRFEEIPFYVSIDIFWGELCEKNFSMSFLDNEHNFLCCKNCVLRVPRNILTKFFFWSKCVFLYLFLTLSKPFSTLSRKNRNRDARTAFYVFTGTVRKLYFPGKMS